MIYSSTKAFDKDMKRLLKKFSSLEEDLETAKKNAIELLHIKKIDNRSVGQVPNYSSKNVQIWKIKKFACKAIKGRGCQSGVRVIYAYFPEEEKIEFIEIYYKGNKDNMDYERAKKYLKQSP